MNVADRIQSLRKSKGISQEEFADQIGVSRQTVSKWESEQSIPDIDKIIVMSDYFEVTTDYILKGIEPQKSAKREPLNANVFLASSTAFNFIGLVVAIAYWFERQTAMAFVWGLGAMAIGVMCFGVGLAFSSQNVEKAKRLFWMINIWLLVFMPLSFIYNSLFSGFIAPYPIFGYSNIHLFIAFPIFWTVYFAICITVVLIQVKMKGRKL